MMSNYHMLMLMCQEICWRSRRLALWMASDCGPPNLLRSIPEDVSRYIISMYLWGRVCIYHIHVSLRTCLDISYPCISEDVSRYIMSVDLWGRVWKYIISTCIYEDVSMCISYPCISEDVSVYVYIVYSYKGYFFS